MALIRLDDPSPDHSYSRTMLPVKRHGRTAAWAVFRDGGYEFHVDDDLRNNIDNGSTIPEFQIEGGRPAAIRFVDGRERIGQS